MVARKYLYTFKSKPPPPKQYLAFIERLNIHTVWWTPDRQSAPTSQPAKEHEHVGWPISTLVAPEKPQDVVSSWGYYLLGYKGNGTQIHRKPGSVSSDARRIACFIFSGHQSSQLKSKMSRCLVTLFWACS